MTGQVISWTHTHPSHTLPRWSLLLDLPLLT